MTDCWRRIVSLEMDGMDEGRRRSVDVIGRGAW